MLINTMKGFLKSLLGQSTSREYHKAQMEIFSNYEQSIYEFNKKLRNSESISELPKPIFILSAGWRSGSTLLQRLICSGEESLLIWGEPYDKCNIIINLAEMFSPFSNSWPDHNYYLTNKNTEIYNSWIANLYPDADSLLNAHRAMLIELFDVPAKKFNYETWGIKEVRFGFKEAVYLKTIFPEAKFIYLERDIEEAYFSYINFSLSRNWYARWPFKKAFTAFQFAKHRRDLLNQFEKARRVTGGIKLHYDQLNDKSLNINELNEYLGINCDISVLDRKVGGKKTKESPIHITYFEKFLIKLADRH